MLPIACTIKKKVTSTVHIVHEPTRSTNQTIRIGYFLRLQKSSSHRVPKLFHDYLYICVRVTQALWFRSPAHTKSEGFPHKPVLLFLKPFFDNPNRTKTHYWFSNETSLNWHNVRFNRLVLRPKRWKILLEASLLHQADVLANNGGSNMLLKQVVTGIDNRYAFLVTMFRGIHTTRTNERRARD